MVDKTLVEFCEELSSSAPVPGGGGVSALVGALAASLGGMVASLTQGKKKYADVQADILRLKTECSHAQEELLNLIRLDAVAFTPLAAAYSLPKNTEQELAHRAAVMEEALLGACMPPLEMLRSVNALIPLLEELAQKGSVLAVSDAGVAAALCEAALKGAVLNIEINAADLKNREKADTLLKEARQLVTDGCRKASELYKQVNERICK